MGYREQAYASIDAFMQREHPEFYPGWLPVTPTDWGVGGPRWRQEATTIVADFEARIGFGIGATWTEIDKLRSKVLEVFLGYLTAKAEAASARATVRSLVS